MTVIASVFTPEGYVIGADGLRKDGETFDTLSTTAQKVFFGAHPSLTFAYAWAGMSGFRLETGEFVNLIEETAAAIHTIRNQDFAGIAEYAEQVAKMLYPKITSADIFTNARLLFVGFFKGIGGRAEVWFSAASRPTLNNVVTYNQGEGVDFGIFSGSEIVWKQMRLTVPPSTVFEASLHLQTYLNRGIAGEGKISDCVGFGGHIHIASVTAEGYSWIVPPAEADSAYGSECSAVEKM